MKRHENNKLATHNQGVLGSSPSGTTISKHQLADFQLIGVFVLTFCKTFAKHGIRKAALKKPLICTIKVNDQFSEDVFTKVTSPLPHNKIL